jgi:cytidine deaminase
MELSASERELVDEARGRIRDHARKRRAAGHYDKLYAFVRSETGTVYEGTPLETSMTQADCCAERHAIANMQHAETESTMLDAVLVAGPVPDTDDRVTTPCGACRHAISQFSDDATVLCSNFVRRDDGWTLFPSIERYTAEELYPAARIEPVWE